MTSFFLSEIDSDHIHSGVALCSANQGLGSLEKTSHIRGEIEQKQVALLETFLLCLTPRYAQAHSSEKVSYSNYVSLNLAGSQPQDLILFSMPLQDTE